MKTNMIVIGGGTGGPSSAAEAKRRNPSLNITIIEQGPFISYAA